MTLPEVLLWREIRGSPDGVYFRRQVPVGEFVLDFYCAKAMLCVEIDGATHDLSLIRDERRDEVLRTIYGIDTIRVQALEVLANPAESANQIVLECLGRIKP